MKLKPADLNRLKGLTLELHRQYGIEETPDSVLAEIEAVYWGNQRDALNFLRYAPVEYVRSLIVDRDLRALGYATTIDTTLLADCVRYEMTTKTLTDCDSPYDHYSESDAIEPEKSQQVLSDSSSHEFVAWVILATFTGFLWGVIAGIILWRVIG